MSVIPVDGSADSFSPGRGLADSLNSYVDRYNPYQAHARYVSDLPAWLRRRSDVMVEADGKHEAVARVR
jgi:hypothetical protein